MPINIQPFLNVIQSILQSVGQVSNLLPPFILPPSLLPPSFIAPPLYKEIAIPVPQPPGITGLPPFIYFDISTFFNATQEQNIKDAISIVLFNWSFHLTQKWNGGLNNGLSQLASCSNAYATKNLKPIWYKGVAITNGRKALEVAMDQFTEMIKDNGFRRSPKSRIDWITIPFYDPIVLATTSTGQNNVPLNFIINATKLDDPGIGFNAGSMFHAWLHRAGFLDPNSTSYFITEASMCVMRGYQPKHPDVPDTIYYQYFD